MFLDNNKILVSADYGVSLSADLGDALGEEESGFQLDQNYPNPFNPVTTIRYHLAEPAEVDLSVFNIAGARVAVLDEGYRSEGSYMVEFSAQNLASGLYFYRLQVNGQLQSRKMVIIK